MSPRRRGRITVKRAATLLVLALTLPFQPTGAGATHQFIEDTLELGLNSVNTQCQSHLGCASFVQSGCQNPADVHKSHNPFLTVTDVSAYTSGGARRVAFKLVDSDAVVGATAQHQLITDVRTSGCAMAPGDASNIQSLGVGDQISFTIPKNAKWFVVYAVNRFTGVSVFHLNEKWRLTFLTH